MYARSDNSGKLYSDILFALSVKVLRAWVVFNGFLVGGKEWRIIHELTSLSRLIDVRTSQAMTAKWRWQQNHKCQNVTTAKKMKNAKRIDEGYGVQAQNEINSHTITKSEMCMKGQRAMSKRLLEGHTNRVDGNMIPQPFGWLHSSRRNREGSKWEDSAVLSAMLTDLKAVTTG